MQAAGSVTLKATTTAATEPIRRWCTPTVGTVYKAVLDDGSTMAVKRLKDANPCERKEFEQYMDVIGKESGSGQNSIGLDYKDQLGVGCSSWACQDS
ncbi:hypothetical protein ACFX2C_012622 [Malus domestica]